MSDNAERRSLKAHPRLIYNTIFSQAGTLAKAILECVMNSVDAQAKRCDITLTNSSFIVSDNGVGFQTREEIETRFEVFGQPHDESENKRYGRFRIGRGQALAYGINTWTTATFEIRCDAKNEGLEYNLKELKKNHPGCLIDVKLYDELSNTRLQETSTDLADWCAWVPIPVTLNGTQVSTDPEDVDDWSEVTDDAWYRFNDKSELKVFNQGVHTQTFSKHQMGIGGEIVSKVALDLNTARNEIKSTCPVWNRIRKVIDRHSDRHAAKSKSLDDGERAALLKRLVAKTLTEDLAERVQIITAATGRHYTIGRTADIRFGYRVTFGPLGCPVADRIHRSNTAFVVADRLLRDTRLSAEEFCRLLDETPGGWGDHSRELLDFESLAAGMNTTFAIISENKYTARERFWMALINSARYDLGRLTAQVHAKFDSGEEALDTDSLAAAYEGTMEMKRTILLGEGPANGWTDGRSYIAINREYMSATPLTLEGFVLMGTLLIHEYCHLNPDIGAHDHDQAFYESYHDLSRTALGVFVNKCISYSPRVSAQQLRKLTKKENQLQDQVTAATNATAALIKQTNRPR